MFSGIIIYVWVYIYGSSIIIYVWATFIHAKSMIIDDFSRPAMNGQSGWYSCILLNTISIDIHLELRFSEYLEIKKLIQMSLYKWPNVLSITMQLWSVDKFLAQY